MALNFCVICDEPFNETWNNPGNKCPKCKEEENNENNDTSATDSRQKTED